MSKTDRKKNGEEWILTIYRLRGKSFLFFLPGQGQGVFGAPHATDRVFPVLAYLIDGWSPGALEASTYNLPTYNIGRQRISSATSWLPPPF